MTKFNVNKENIDKKKIKLVTNSKVETKTSIDQRKKKEIAKKIAKIRRELNEKIGITSNFKIPIKVKSEPKIETSEKKPLQQQESIKAQRVNDNVHQKSFKKKDRLQKPKPFVYKLAMKTLNSY
jgi:aldehyde:ferredoxin oxidoreductase